MPASRHCDHERRLPPSPTALPLFYGSRSAGVGPGLVDAPIHILCVASVCARAVWCVVCVWMGIARVCSSRPVPTREGPVCRAPAPARVHTSQPHRLFREQTLDLPMCWWPTRLAACSLPHPPHSLPTPLPRPTGVCVFGPVCDMRMWCDDTWIRMLPHGSWWRVGGGRLRCPACEPHDGARCPTPHRR